MGLTPRGRLLEGGVGPAVVEGPERRRGAPTLWTTRSRSGAGAVRSGRMTHIEVSGEAVAALGDTLAGVADTLEALAAGDTRDDAYGPGSVAGAVDRLLGDWDLTRRRLCTALREAATAARSAGTMYVDTETCVSASLTVPGTR